MNRSNITFFIMSIVIILGTFVIYKYNSNKYATQSAMLVIPLEENTQTLGTSSSITISSITNSSTSKENYNIVKTTSVDNTTINSIVSTIGSTKVSTTKNTTSKTQIDTTIEIKTEPNFPISLNNITIEELQYIKGIGEATARKIIDYRASIGNFTSRYQLLEIDGIGEVKMNTIMEYTYIENEDFNYNDNLEDPTYNSEQYYIENNYIDNNTLEEYYEEPIVTESPYPINLNDATIDDLMLIPNMTLKVAQEILNLRDSIQHYSNPYELLYINEISEKYLSEIIEYISVE